MPISEKIKMHIDSIDESEEFKKLMLSILSEEDKGTFRFKIVYDELVNEYLKESEDSDS